MNDLPKPSRLTRRTLAEKDASLRRIFRGYCTILVSLALVLIVGGLYQLGVL
jgi:hypothetical protein